jgi:hypothetical protein
MVAAVTFCNFLSTESYWKQAEYFLGHQKMSINVYDPGHGTPANLSGALGRSLRSNPVEFAGMSWAASWSLLLNTRKNATKLKIQSRFRKKGSPIPAWWSSHRLPWVESAQINPMAPFRGALPRATKRLAGMKTPGVRACCFTLSMEAPCRSMKM